MGAFSLIVVINLLNSINKNETISMFYESPISSQEFEAVFKINQPCKLGRWISSDWPCFQNWFTDKSFDFDKFEGQFDDIEVPVISCNEAVSYDSAKSKTKLKDFINEVKLGASSKYLKDWHFCENIENTSDVFKVPDFFSCDWLNDSLVHNRKEDYRFLYFGGSETWTPFHVDVFCSYSWSVNITGHKTWFFVSAEHMTDIEEANPPNDLRVCDHLMKKAIKIEQAPGEAIFVPSTWFHQVYNRGVTVSINHNWFNGHNIKCIFDLLKEDLELIKYEISFLKQAMGSEYAEHCQVLLRANSGLNFHELKDILLFASRNKLYDQFQREQASIYLDKVEKILESEQV